MSNISLRELILRNERLSSARERISTIATNFRQNVSNAVSGFKKNVGPRLVATMLAGATVASMASCDSLKPVEHGDILTEVNQIEITNGVTFGTLSSDNSSQCIDVLKNMYPYKSLPYKFLESQNMFEYNASGAIDTDSKDRFKSIIVTDENSDENDVYMYLEVYKADEKVYCFWKLKYILEDKDYQDLKFLGAGPCDLRMMGFITKMDEKYTPEIKYKRVLTSHAKDIINSWVRVRKYGFVVLDDVNNSTGEIKVRAISMNEYYCREDIYSVNLKDGELWDYWIDKGNTPEDLLTKNLFKCETQYGKGFDGDLNYRIITGIHVKTQKAVESVPFENVGEYQIMKDFQFVYNPEVRDYSNYYHEIEKVNKFYKKEREFIIKNYYNNIELMK